MIKMSQLFELPTVYEALSPSPKFPLRAFLFYPLKKLMARFLMERGYPFFFPDRKWSGSKT
jgi:hypothetical protein